MKVKESVKPVIPIDHYLDSIKRLNKLGVKFITYNDLLFENDYDFENGYPEEFKRWNSKIKDTNDDNIYVLIQHDVDSGFESSIDLSKREIDLGALVSIMTFARWSGYAYDDLNLGKDLVDYPICFKDLHFLKSHGCTIGYHCNAWHNSNYKDKEVFKFFYEDLMMLKEFDIKFFSPHGGKVIDGIGNVSFNYMENIKSGGYKEYYLNPDDWEYLSKVRWVHNRFSCKFNGYYSDGGLSRRLKLNKEETDLNRWIDNLKPGKRYRMVIHPQYYGSGELKKFDTDLSWYNNLF
jgi:hypothetical protein